MQKAADKRKSTPLLLALILLLPGISEASRYEVNYSGLNLTLTGFIDLDANPNGIYQGSNAFSTAVVEDYEIRAAGDLRGNFIFTPANSSIGNSSGWELDWEVTNSGIFITSPVSSTSTNGPPSSEIVRTSAGNHWLRLTDTFVDYRNNDNGGNQITNYDTTPFPLAFNTFLPNGGPFVSTLIPLPSALFFLAPAVAAVVVVGKRKSQHKFPREIS